MNLLIFIITFLTSQNVYSQTLKTQNLPKYDKQWYHFGFTLGLMNTNLKIDFQDYSTANKIYSTSSPGFNVGIICDLKLSKNINVRLIPSLTFTQRDIFIQMTNEAPIMKSVENSRFLQNFGKKCEKVWRFFLKISVSIGAKDWKSCRSRKTLQNEYLVAKFCFDTAENEPSKVWPFGWKIGERFGIESCT